VNDNSNVMADFKAISDRNLNHFKELAAAGGAQQPGEQKIDPRQFGTTVPKPPPNLPYAIATLKAPFTKGSPDPAYLEKLPGAESDIEPNIVSFGDPVTGELNVGLAGGVTPAGSAEWGQEPSATLFPGRWGSGDEVSTRAGVTSVFLFDPNQFSAIDIKATVGWGIHPLPGDDPTRIFYSAFDLRAGTAASALNGYVAIYAAVYLTVALANAEKVLSTTNSVATIMDIAIDATHHGNQEFSPIEPFLRLDSAFNPDPFKKVVLGGLLPVLKSADRIITEVSVYLAGMRGGVNDPNAGWLSTGFINNEHGGYGIVNRKSPIVIDQINIDGHPKEPA
jgi:hypothetical protein